LTDEKTQGTVPRKAVIGEWKRQRGTFLFTGTAEPVVENCYGVAIRWAKPGEKGQLKLTGKESLPTYILE